MKLLNIEDILPDILAFLPIFYLAMEHILNTFWIPFCYFLIALEVLATPGTFSLFEDPLLSSSVAPSLLKHLRKSS